MFLTQETIEDINSNFDQYTILKKIGTGSFSNVYLATQNSTGQKVAIKLLKIESDETEESIRVKSSRFKREMKLCTELSHANIVNVLDFGKISGERLFTVFEFIPGLTLAELIQKEGSLSVERSKNIMQQTLEAITAAHNMGVIHRDLKPENIMISSTGDNVKILDFGISTFINSQKMNFTRVTMTREFLGTPAYSAPEQLRGETVTTKTDLFACGLILIECLSGSAPYAGLNTARLVQKQLSAAPVPLPPSISGHSLASLLNWVLEKNPERRSADAGQVLNRYKTIDFES